MNDELYDTAVAGDSTVDTNIKPTDVDYSTCLLYTSDAADE